MTSSHSETSVFEYEYTSEFAQLYKNTGKSISQQERREIVLSEQKEKRHNVVDQHRDFSELFLEDEESEEMSECSEPMEITAEKPRRNKFALMHSEWLTDIPSDLEDNWLVKLVPDGFRVLVIAKKHKTVVSNERGKVVTFKSYLPGGGFGKTSGLTVLDGIYSKATKTIFVLDCLYWNTLSMINSETNFRFYWLKNQFEDSSKLQETNKQHKFHILDFFPAERSLIQEKLFQSSAQNILYTGIIFIHKELQYAFQQTPLFCWLYTYMLPEKLGIDVPEELMNRVPENYENVEKYLETLEKKHHQKQSYRDRRKQKMEMDTL